MVVISRLLSLSQFKLSFLNEYIQEHLVCPIEMTFDVDAFSYKVFWFLINDCHSMTMFELVEKGKFFYFHASHFQTNWAAKIWWISMDRCFKEVHLPYITFIFLIRNVVPMTYHRRIGGGLHAHLEYTTSMISQF